MAARSSPPRTRSKGRALCINTGREVASRLIASTGSRGGNQLRQGVLAAAAVADGSGLGRGWRSSSSTSTRALMLSTR